MKRSIVAKLAYERWFHENEGSSDCKEIDSRIDDLLRKHLPEAVYDKYQDLSCELQTAIERWAWFEGFMAHGSDSDVV